MNDNNPFGSMIFDGKEYHLDEQAFLSNRVFPSWWGDAEEGEKYTAEYSANAHDNEGNNYMIYWQFEAVKGEEPEDESNYPWDSDHVSMVSIQ